MAQESVQFVRCLGCGRELAPEDYLCSECGFCQYCCKCSVDTSPETTLPGD